MRRVEWPRTLKKRLPDDDGRVSGKEAIPSLCYQPREVAIQPGGKVGLFAVSTTRISKNQEDGSKQGDLRKIKRPQNSSKSNALCLHRIKASIRRGGKGYEGPSPIQTCSTRQNQLTRSCGLQPPRRAEETENKKNKKTHSLNGTAPVRREPRNLEGEESERGRDGV